MFKDIKENMIIMDEQLGEILAVNEKVQTRTKWKLELQSSQSEIKNSLDGLRRKLETEEWVSEFKDRAMYTTWRTQRKKTEKKMNRASMTYGTK